MKRVGAGLIALVGLLAGILLVRPGSQPTPVVRLDLRPPPDVAGEGTSLLLVTWDTVRADRVSAYGHTVPTTPTFDAFAAQGVFFERFLVPQATTLPTHLSLFTGLHPEEHGVLANSTQGARYVVSPRIVPLAQHLGERGFHTAGFVSSTPLKPGSGAERGFQVYGHPSGAEHRGELTVDAAIGWLAEVPEGAPFMLWVHLVDPHFPWDTPPGWEGRLPAEPDPEGWLTERGIDVAPRFLGRLQAYDAEIGYTDAQTGRLLAALHAEGRAGDTAVVIVGDHGEGLGQHDHKEHGGVWHEQLATVFALRVPGGPVERVAAPTTAEDLVPTLVPLVDWPDEAGLLAPMSGIDARTAPLDRTIVSRRSDREIRQQSVRTPAWSVSDGRTAVLGSDRGVQISYDLAVDPHQRTGVRDRAQGVAAYAVLASHRRRWAVKAAELGSGGEVELDAKTRQELEALGYVE